MTVSKRELGDLRTAMGPMSAVSSRLSQDDALAARMIEAVHAGDSRRVGQVFTDLGINGVTYRRGPIPGKTGTPESFSFSPNDRWHIEITIEFDKP